MNDNILKFRPQDYTDLQHKWMLVRQKGKKKFLK